jgi:lysophospholipase L1-like esterase
MALEELMLEDGLHYNDRGNAVVGQKIAQAIAEAL